MPTAAAYVKAYPVQADAAGLRAADQRRRIEEAVAARGWTLGEVIEDPGADARHPALERLLADPPAVDKVVVTSLDRLGLRTGRILRVARSLADAGIDLVSLDEGIDTGEDDRARLEPTLAGLARWESDRLLRGAGGWDPERLRAYGFRPATLVDVGVAGGTHALYEAFEDAYLVLVEPLREFHEPLGHLLEERPGELIPTAVGEREGAMTITLDTPLERSSVLESVHARPAAERREVPVTTLDRLAAERSWADPIGLKVDAEGFDMQVIAGAVELLPRCEFVIAEGSIRPRFRDEATCIGLIDMMRSHGFEMRDVVDAVSLSSFLFADLLFTPRG